MNVPFLLCFFSRPFNGTSPQDAHHACLTRPLFRFAPGHGTCLAAVILCLYVLSLLQCWISYSGGSDADDLCTSRPWSNTVRRSQLCKFRYACFTIILFVFVTIRPHIADFTSPFWLLPLCVSQFHLLPGGGVLLPVEFWKFVCCQKNFLSSPM